MFGKVSAFDHSKNYGFIQGEDGNSYFIHKSNLNGEFINRGYFVLFKTYINDRSDYNAKNVIVIESWEREKKYGKKHK